MADWTDEQRQNAAVIYQAGLDVGASMRDIQIAIMAAIVESGLRNLDYGDRDSIGMFQQRDAWGSREDRLDPYKSAKMFFLGGHAGQRGLLDFADRDSMSLGQAAQAVQVSAFPDRYQEHLTDAEALLHQINPASGADTLAQVPGLDAVATPPPPMPGAAPSMPTVTEVNGLGEVTADAAGLGESKFEPEGQPSLLDTPKFGQPTVDPMASLKMPTLEDMGIQNPAGDTAAGWRAAIVAAAKKMLGTPYVWGGTNYSGVDCSGLIKLLYGKQGFDLPRLSADQARYGTRIDFSKLRPGDIVAIDNSSRNHGADHVAIYIGNGHVIEAPRPGGVVEIGSLDEFHGGWGVSLD